MQLALHAIISLSPKLVKRKRKRFVRARVSQVNYVDIDLMIPLNNRSALVIAFVTSSE
jgi:hypothetical protein